MDLFFVLIRFLKELFVKDSGVQYLDESIVREKLNSFTVKIITRINTFDDSIVTRYYEVLGLTPEREITVFHSWRTNYAVNKICKYIVEIVEIHSGKKIRAKKLYKVVKNQYNGRVLIDGITIDFKQSS